MGGIGSCSGTLIALGEELIVTTDFNIELCYIRSIMPYDRNQRDNDSAVVAVARSILEFGFRNPIIVDCEGVIVAGHTRLKGGAEAQADEGAGTRGGGSDT